jgi:hypothetical protein
MSDSIKVNNYKLIDTEAYDKPTVGYIKLPKFILIERILHLNENKVDNNNNLDNIDDNKIDNNFKSDLRNTKFKRARHDLEAESASRYFAIKEFAASGTCDINQATLGTNLKEQLQEKLKVTETKKKSIFGDTSDEESIEEEIELDLLTQPDQNNIIADIKNEKEDESTIKSKESTKTIKSKESSASINRFDIIDCKRFGHVSTIHKDSFITAIDINQGDDNYHVAPIDLSVIGEKPIYFYPLRRYYTFRRHFGYIKGHTSYTLSKEIYFETHGIFKEGTSFILDEITFR